jgi:hypothetical protein
LKILKSFFQKKYIEKMSHLLELNLDEAMELIIKVQTNKVNSATKYLNELKTNPIKRRKELDELYRTHYRCMRKKGEMRMTYVNKKNELIKEFDEKNAIENDENLIK